VIRNQGLNIISVSDLFQSVFVEFQYYKLNSCYKYMQISGGSRNLSMPCLEPTSMVGHPCIVAVKLRALGEGCTTETFMPAYFLRVGGAGVP
jgi:hypothetical protein